ncbi:MAG: hypothetical protein V7K90_15895 [Nostoc sp.]|uniref:hypothetical protein n=1 Tax=Nostoc sp. TaxID=1180 RepID=UPI002FF95259
MADKTLATFRIEPEEWESFKALATGSNSTASAILLRFIKSCLDAKQILSTSSTLNTNYSLDSIEALVDKRIKLSIDSIEALVDKRIEVNLDNIEVLIDKRIEASLAEVRSQLEAQLEELRGKSKAR